MDGVDGVGWSRMENDSGVGGREEWGELGKRRGGGEFGGKEGAA